jgi:hypothetical protein
MDRTGLKILENNNIQSIISVNTNILLRRFRLKFLRIMCSTSCYKERVNFENTLYTIHGYKNSQYIPLVFALLPNKSSAVYCHMWKFILEKCGEFNLTFEPKEIFVDFEKSMHIVIRETFPLVKISGCLFHLKQAGYRKLQNLGLAKFIWTDSPK